MRRVREVEFTEAEAPALDSDPWLSDALRMLRGVMVKYPIATQAAFSALVREGRRYAETAEGAALRDSLAASPEIAKLRDVWAVGTLNILRADAEGPIPSALVEAFAAAAARLTEEQLSHTFESTDHVIG